MLTYCAQKLRDISIAVILEVLKDFLTATLFVDVVGVRLVVGAVVKHNSLSVIISTWRFSAQPCSPDFRFEFPAPWFLSL